MRLWVWTALVFVVTLLLAVMFKLPFWLFVVVVVPLLIIVFTYVSVSYSFRESLQPEEIPKRGFSSRAKALEVETKRMSPHGFDQIDAFYLRMIPDAVVSILKHKDEPIHFCLYHLGQKVTCDIVTRYAHGYALTTCNTVDGGMLPRPKRNLLQIITQVSYEDLYNVHKKGHLFLSSKGLSPFDIPREEFREYFMNRIHEQARFIRKIPLWPVHLVIWTIMRRGRTYQKEIEMQYRDNSIELYET